MLQILLSGVVVGAQYGLLALSFFVIFAVTRTFHLAHISVLNWSAYALYTGYILLDWPIVASILLAIVVAAVFGLAVESLVYQPIRARGAESLTIFVGSMAVLFVAQAVLGLTFGDLGRRVLDNVPAPLFAGDGLRISIFDGITVATLVVLSAAVWVLMHHTRIGKGLRAVQENPELARYFGFDVPKLYRHSFMIGSALLVAPASLYALRSGVHPDLGFVPVLIAIISVIAGGQENQSGAIAVAFMLGLIQNVTLIWVSSEWQTVVAFTALFALMIWRPTGLRGAVAVRTVR